MALNKWRCSISGWATFWLAFASLGCASLARIQPATTWRPGIAPITAGAEEGHRVGRAALPPGKSNMPAKPLPGERIPLPKESERELAKSEIDELPEPVRPPFESGVETAPRGGEGPSIDLLPSIEPDEIALEPPIEITVAAPARRQVGGTATYRVTLRNSADHPSDGLIVRCRFGDALVFSGSDRREVLQRITRVLPGEARPIDLSLSCDKIGSQCCRFSVARLDGNHEVELAARDACVEFVTRHIEIDLIGPMQRTQGSRAEFNVSLSNLSQTTIDDVEATIAYDRALIVREASSDAVQRTGQIGWRLGRLRPMERVQLQVEFECLTPAHRACVRVEARGAGVAIEHEEACVEVVPVPGTLDLTIRDRNDPLVTGGNGAYEVSVQNIGLQPARKLVLESSIPGNLKILSATARLGDQPLTLKYASESGRLIFDPFEQLAPNARLVYIFEVEALRPGMAEFRANLTSALSSAVISVSEPTSIVDP